MRFGFPASIIVVLLAFLPLLGSEEGLLVVQRRGTGSWVLSWQGKEYRCTVGRNGVAKAGMKREGDGRTPSGIFPLRNLYFRPDRIHGETLPAALKPTALTPEDGWCDDPGDPRYNRPVRLPYPASHEELWRTNDGLYDLIIPIGYNDEPVVPGLGSAIFLHVARQDLGPTAGCVALSRQDLVEILTTLKATTRIRIVAD